MGKLETQVGHKHVLSFLLLSSEHEMSRKGRCWYVPKISCFLSTWALLQDFDPNFILLFTLIFQQKRISLKVLLSLLWKKQDIIIPQRAVGLASHKGQTLLFQTFLISRNEMQKAKHTDVTISTIHLFSTQSCGFVVEKLWLAKPN